MISNIYKILVYFFKIKKSSKTNKIYYFYKQKNFIYNNCNVISSNYDYTKQFSLKKKTTRNIMKRKNN